MGVGPTTPIEAPPLTPGRMGLVPAARALGRLHEGALPIRWEGGFAYEPETCGGTNTGSGDPCGSAAKTLTTNPNANVEFEPFYVWAGDACKTQSPAARDWEGRAMRKLLAHQSHDVEFEMWTGTLAKAAAPDWPNPFLADPAANTISQGAMSPLDALGCLEQALGDCGDGIDGMIHATRSVVTQWVSSWLVFPDGPNLLRTILGTVVVAGTGYDGSGPTGDDPAADGSVWAYATGMVDVYLSTIQLIGDNMIESTNRSTNLTSFRAERMAAYTFDCCHLAVEIDAPACPGIAGS